MVNSQIKNLARHSSIYTLSTFVQRALGFVLLPIYTDTAYISSRSEYGDMSLVYTFIAFMNVIYLYGLDAALLRYFFIGKFRREDVYKTSFITVFVNSIFLSALIYLFAPQIAQFILADEKYTLLIQVAAGILFFDGLGNLPYHILRAEEKSITYSTMRIGRFLLELALNIVFVVYLKQGVLGILYANLIASCMNLIMLHPFQAKYLKGAFNRAAFKELLLFGLPMLPNGVAYLITEVSDKFVMRLLLDKDALGIYASNYKFGSLLLLVVMAFKTAWQPFFLKVANQDNAKQIYAKVLTYFTLGGVLIVVLASYFMDYFLTLPLLAGKPIMGKMYWSGIGIIPIILISYLFYGLYANFMVGVYITKKSHLMIIFTGLAAVVNVVSNLYLMPAFGIMGAAIATLIAYALMALSIFIANQIIYPIKYEFGRVGLLLGYLMTMLFLLYVFNMSFLMRLAILSISLMLILLCGFFRKSEWVQLKGSLKRR